MTVIGTLFLGLVMLAVGAYLFYLLRKAVIIIAFLSGIYLIFFTEYFILGCIALAVWLVVACASEKIEDTSKAEDKRKETSPAKSAFRHNRRRTSSMGRMNYILMWIIPVFWPVLIFQAFFRDKQAGKLDAYDYEQHLKSNGK